MRLVGEGSSKQEYRDTVREVLSALVGKGSGQLSQAELGRLVGRDRRAVSKWFNGSTVPSEDCHELLVAQVAERLGDDDAVVLRDALDGYYRVDDDQRLVRGHAEGDLSATGPRARPAWETSLLGVIETHGGLFPTAAGWLGDDIAEIGLDHWRLASPKVATSIPTYVTRSIDNELDRRLRTFDGDVTPPIVILVGPPKAGKTRTIVEALRRPANQLRHRRLHEPVRRTAGRDTLPEYVEALKAAVNATTKAVLDNWGNDTGLRRHALNAVLFIDDLQDHFYDPGDRHHGRGTPIRQLLEAVADLMVPVVATCHPYPLVADHRQLGISEDDQQWLNDHAIWLPEELDEAETNEAIESLLADRADPATTKPETVRRLGGFLADLDTLHRMIATARTDAAAGDPHGIARSAIINALCDTRLFVAGHAKPDTVLDYATRYATNLGYRTATLLEQALDWATTPPHPNANPIAPYDPTTGAVELLDVLMPTLLVAHRTMLADVKLPDRALNHAGLVLYSMDQQALAAEWWMRAASAGDGIAMYNLGTLRHSQGLLDDDPTGDDAVTWWTQAARAGVTKALLNLGILRSGQDRVDEDADGDDAATWWTQAAENGNLDAMVYLGILRLGQGRLDGDLNGDHAAKWWMRAAKAGDTDAMSDLGGVRYTQGRLDRDLNGDDAATWWTRAANAGHSNAMTNLGFLCRRRGCLEGDPDGNDAVSWWTKAANAGHSNAMNNLGILRFYQGHSDDDADRNDAATWWTRAADAGHTNAMTNLGALRRDQGRLKDDPDGDDATTWWTKAAEAGNTNAMIELAYLRHDEGRVRDDPDGDDTLAWLGAAAAGHTEDTFEASLDRHRQGPFDDDPDDTAVWWTWTAT